MIEITSKKHKPIKSFKSSEHNKIIIILYIFVISTFCLMLNTKEFGITTKIIFMIMIIFLFFVLYWFFNFEFEIYHTYFTICFQMIFFPIKIVLVKILFNNIEWIDGEEIQGLKMTIFKIKFYLKNGKTKNYSFMGNKKEFLNILYNWRNISECENNKPEKNRPLRRLTGL